MTTHLPATTATHALTVISEPSRDGFLLTELDGGARARVLYQRCAEARAQNLPSQDFAALQVDVSGRALSFCVADGVGSSFRGDFAASYLARRLVGWLSQLATPLPSAEQAGASLTTDMTSWADAAREELAALPVDLNAPALVREVLEELRRDYGSETVYLGARLTLPDTADVVEGLFCWMGNVSLRLQCAGDDEPLPFCADDDSARWSTVRGPRGAVSVRRLSLHGLRRLIVHTDGAEAIGSEIGRLSDDDLQRRAAALLETATSDDVTALDLVWPERTTPDGAPGERKRAEP